MSVEKVIAKNKRAYHEYFVREKLEAGIQLVGCEVKSVRATHITIRDSYARLKDNELFLMNCRIESYPNASYEPPHPDRDRKLLLHKKEIVKWAHKMDTKGFTIVPLQVYLKNNRIKVELGLCEPKKLFDKRADKKDKDVKRDIDRAIRSNW